MAKHHRQVVKVQKIIRSRRLPALGNQLAEVLQKSLKAGIDRRTRVLRKGGINSNEEQEYYNWLAETVLVRADNRRFLAKTTIELLGGKVKE